MKEKTRKKKNERKSTKEKTRKKKHERKKTCNEKHAISKGNRITAHKHEISAENHPAKH
jgi:hypothetical protein